MSGENTLYYKFYALQKEWLKQVESILIEQIPFIKSLKEKVSPYDKDNKLDMESCDRYAWVEKSSLIIESQNFRFTIIDDDYDFTIKYEILETFTRENSVDVLGIKPDGNLLWDYKGCEADPVFYVKWGNYFIFESFIREIEYLDYVLKENEFCPGQCEYLSITEEEQNKRRDKPDHICMKYNQRVKHGAYHPRLMKCKECMKND